MRCIPKDWRRGGVLECMKNDQIKAIVEEAEYQEAVKQGYYDEDGNYIYYTEADLAAQQAAVQPAAAQPQKPIQKQKVVRIYEINLTNLQILPNLLMSRSLSMTYLFTKLWQFYDLLTLTGMKIRNLRYGFIFCAKNN